MNSRVVAEVYVDTQAHNIDIPFTYLVPDGMAALLLRGKRVMVPFGMGNRKIQGIVVRVYSSEDMSAKLKPIASIVDEEPVLSEKQFEIVSFLVTHTFCTHYEALKTILPVGANMQAVEKYFVNPEIDLSEQLNLSEQERRLTAFLSSAKTKEELASFLHAKQNPDKQSAVKSLLDRKVVIKAEEFKRKAPQKTKKMVRVVRMQKHEIALSKKQQEVLSLLNDVQVAHPGELCRLCGVTEGVIKALVKKGAAEYFTVTVDDKTPTVPGEFNQQPLSEVVLSQEQQQVFEQVKRLLQSDAPQAALLYGVTGSGKTQIYIKAIEETLQQGKTAMLLVPEIALTPQLTQQMEKLFGNYAAVLHSALSVTKRFETYQKIKSGNVRIVIGTRSAVFAPLENIGVVILDEEGESSYKSDAAPRYHARDVAKLICKQNNALLILGSATPSVDSFYNAQIGKYSLFKLTERYADATLPQVCVVNMRKEIERRNFSPLSDTLRTAIQATLSRGEQVILLINRRGYNSVATCLSCAQVIKCPACDVAMTYHKTNHSMMCHYCGHTEPFVQKCPACGSQSIKLSGIGTQRLEKELFDCFPDAKVLRMDADTTYSRDAYEKSFSAFERGEYDILIGTQMIAKGLNFPNVTLVGVLNADSGLYSADFKSSERTFSLITQVVGRSGRNEKQGTAIIQTLEPDNPVIIFAAQQDYEGFYRDEIGMRKAMFCPPFCDMVSVGISGENERAVASCAQLALAMLKKQTENTAGIALRVMGVSPAQIYKISNKYRWRIVMKCRLNEPMRKIIADLLCECMADKRFAGISVFADVNGDFSV